ncbi:MAG: hypothetical protein ACREIT_07590 [Tepidisphaeraceae bacterium]
MTFDDNPGSTDTLHLPHDLGRRIAEAARMAVAVHLFQTAGEATTSFAKAGATPSSHDMQMTPRRRIVIGGAGPSQIRFTDEPTPPAAAASDRPAGGASIPGIPIPGIESPRGRLP